MRLSEQYVKALAEVFEKSSILSLPESVRSDLYSDNPTPDTIAQAMAIFSKMVGAGSGIPTLSHL